MRRLQLQATCRAKDERQGTRVRGLLALVLVLMLALTACGTDEAGNDVVTDDPASDEGDGTDVAANEEYCELARELTEGEGFPSEDQLRSYQELAPEEISEEVDLVMGRLIEDGPGAFGELMADPESAEAFERIEAFEAEECGIEHGEEEEPPEGVSTELDPDAQRVDVSATEYDFEFEPPSAGAVSFVMSNDGEESHFMLVSRIAEGVTLDEALQAEDPEEEGLAENIGESDTAPPGEEEVLTIDNLEPGTYGMLCFIPAPDGEPHAFKGMAVEFTVE